MAHAGGRPTKYKIEYNDQVFKLCLLGATDAQIANILDIDEATLNRWKIEYPKFCESLRSGKSEADSKVAQSLYNRALGYKQKATKFATHEGKITDTKDYIENVVPDTTACIFWLKNRQSKQWRDKVETEITGKDGADFVIKIKRKDDIE